MGRERHPGAQPEGPGIAAECLETKVNWAQQLEMKWLFVSKGTMEPMNQSCKTVNSDKLFSQSLLLLQRKRKLDVQ